MNTIVERRDTQVVRSAAGTSQDLPEEIAHDGELLANLGDVFKRLETLPHEHRLQAVLDRTAEFCGNLANSSSHPLAISFAAGIWTFVNTIVATLKEGHDLPGETVSTLSNLTFRWAIAMVACGEVVNPPDVGFETTDDGDREVLLYWRSREERVLVVSVRGDHCEYMATRLAKDGTLRHQDGNLELDSNNIEATIRWLRTGRPK